MRDAVEQICHIGWAMMISAAPVVTTPQAKRQALQGIQAARGIAAILVVVYHGSRMLALPQYVGYVPLHGVFAFGHAGVDFFFVLSGFIISYVHHADVGQPLRLAHYVFQRVTRIYPIYWIATAIVVVEILMSHDLAGRLRPLHVAASLLLIPHGEEPVLGVAWTLEHEILFYVAFGLAILSARVGHVLLFGCLVLMALVIWDPPSNVLEMFLGTLYHLQFVMGIGAAMLVLHCRVPAPRSLACVGICAFTAAGAAEDAGLIVTAGPVSMLVFGAASALTISGLASAERRGSLTVGPFGALLGAASYAIYLIHVSVISNSAWLAARLGVIKLLPGWAVVLITTSLAIGAACALHLFIERPLTAAIRRHLPHPQRQAALQTERQGAPLP